MRMAEGSGEWESAAGFVGEALDYVNTHMTEDISVRDIADALNVSQSYLSLSLIHILDSSVRMAVGMIHTKDQLFVQIGWKSVDLKFRRLFLSLRM